MKKYKTIYIDPPWKYGKWGKTNPISRPNSKIYPMPYPTMTIEEISNMPIKNLAAENCELYLWTTQKYLPIAFDIIKIWGFKYCQTINWCKKPRGLGQGGIYCPTNEFLLLNRIGKMPKVRRIDSTWFLIKRPHNSHSTKPAFFRQLIKRVSNPPRIELFARKPNNVLFEDDSWKGWDVWGNEVESNIEL